MEPREDILGRIRSRLNRDARDAPAAQHRMREWLRARRQGPRPEIEADTPARFAARAAALSSTVDAVEEIAHAPAAVARYLAANSLPLAAVCTPQVAALPWSAAGIEVAARAARDEDLVGITGCFCAIADTGTLMLVSGAASPAAVSLLPETHVAIVPVSRIVPCMEEAWGLARAELGELPRAVNFVSGPSRTGDIEQTIVIGAHGPYRVHLILVRGA